MDKIDKIDNLLMEVLGRNAFNNDMKVDSDVTKLVKTITYLKSQLIINERWCDVDGKKHINEVMEQAESILSKKI